MQNTTLKMTGRSIRISIGRFAALFLIIALSVGFFAGLKLTKADMQKTLGLYLKNQQMYDFRLISTLGFTSEDETSFEKMDGVRSAEGSKSVDLLMEFDGNILPYTVLAIPEKINLPSLMEGRMPDADSECIADANVFNAEDIGKTITVAAENAEDSADKLKTKTYTIVGLAESPLYLGLDRGTTTLSGGKPKGFLYLSPEAFETEIYTDLYLTLTDNAAVYSEEYDRLTKQYKPDVAKLCEQTAQNHYDWLLAETGLTAEMAETAGIYEPDTYILTRSENAGYVSFENDTSIVSGIANVFPVFFILVAMLVCITTMSRMVHEERTQIGVLKAMGFSNKGIIGKYLLYVGSATLLGWGVGYFLGTRGIPQVFWFAYNSIYDFSSLSYCFNPWIMGGTLVASLLGTMGSTLYACRRALMSEPAKLIRPKVPKAGKRIVLERIGFLWNRLPFLQKVTMRNMFRYKSRFLMMIIGISGCTALLVTGFGVRDSLLPTGDIQYGEILKYDIEAEFQEPQEPQNTILKKTDGVGRYLLLEESSADILSAEKTQSVRLLSFDTDNVRDFLCLSDGSAELAIPADGEVMLSRQAANKLGVQPGEKIKLRNSDREIYELRLSGVFENHIDNYAVISAETYRECVNAWEPKRAFILAEKDVDTLADTLLAADGVNGITILADRKDSIDDSLSCLNYIIFLIIFFAGALAFVVIYNLTNINIAERSREIATVKVLGFYPKETGAYILRENLILSALAALVGLPLGVILHRFVLYMIDIDGLLFPVQISGSSYLLAFMLTILFAFFVNLYMKRKVGKIHMAESLKTVE